MALIPGWFTLALLFLAAWRTWALVGIDDISEPLRRHVTGKVREFLECPFCSGTWIALGWWGAWQLWPHGTLIAAGAASVAAGVALTERLSS